MADPGLGERYLALLAEDRPVEDYEAVLRGAAGAGVEPAEAARVHDLALTVRGLREVDRRRESELTALVETVADLAAHKDVDDVLQAIVRRVRTLLGCDVSYLSLNDDKAGLTYMRVTAGIHSAEFRNVTLGFGEGLGGLVAQTAQPYATSDYFNDPRFEHTGPIDSAVGGEEINAILGVPLLLGRTVIGVLYAANHEKRGFGREDIDLMTSFAAHAAVALDNARMIAETQAVLADLRETGELLQRNVEGVQRAALAHDRLAAVVLQGGGLEEIAAELGEVLEQPVRVLDDQGRTRAESGGGAEPTEEELEQVRQSLQDNRTLITEGLSIAPVWAGGDPLVAVMVRHAVDDVNRRILERAALTSALIMVVQRSVAETESRLRGDLLLDLLVGRAGLGSLTARANLLGVDLSRPHAVLVIDGVDTVIRAAAKDLVAGSGGLAAEVGERLALVLTDTPGLEAGRQLLERVVRTGPGPRRPVGRVVPTIGVAWPVIGVDGVRSGHEEATRCLNALLGLGRRGDVADTAALGFVGLLLGKGDPAAHVRAVLGPVLDYDRQRRTSLTQTVEVWLAQDRHLGRTGEQLHVHPNTVTQRLDRVASLLGPGWQAPDRLLELQLALRLRRVVPQGPPPPEGVEPGESG